MTKLYDDRTGRLLIVGDSITLGATGISGNEIAHAVVTSYVEYLAESLPGMDIAIDAAVHRTTTEARAMIAPLLEIHKPRYVLLMVGNNDADIEWKRFIMTGGRMVRHRVNVQRYTENLLELVRTIRAAQAQPILTDIVTHDLARRAVHLSGIAGRDLSVLIESGGGQVESDRRAVHYKEALQHVLEETGAPYAPYGAALDEEGPSNMLSEDGVHPNQAGHAVIARVIMAALTNLFPSLARSLITPPDAR